MGFIMVQKAVRVRFMSPDRLATLKIISKNDSAGTYFQSG